MIRFRVARRSGGWSRPLKLKGAMRAVRRRAKGFGAPWRIKRRGGAFGRPREVLAEAIARFHDLLEKAPAGEVLILAGAAGELRVRVVEVDPPIIQTIGNSKVDAFHTAIVSRFHPESWGICNRRYIDGTTTWTQHCPWPPPDPGANAEDYHGSAAVMAAIAGFAAENALELEVGRVIYNERVFDRIRGWHDSPGIGHEDHVHMEGFPERTGSPRTSCP